MSHAATAKQRMSSIDSLRFISILYIVIFHSLVYTQPQFVGTGWDTFGVVLCTGMRFAVPFFFLAAGFFFAARSQKTGDTQVWSLCWTYVGRILLIWLFWNLVYVIPSFEDYQRLGVMKSIEFTVGKKYPGVVKLLMEGFRGHLWFLMSLAWSMLILAAGMAARRMGLALAVGFGLFVVGLLMGAYVDTALGFSSPVSSRNGPFFGAIFVCLGYYLQRHQDFFADIRLAALFPLGMALYMLEMVALHNFDPGAITTTPNYLLGSIPAGVGVFCFGLAVPQWGAGTIMPALGRLTLGVYACHFLFIKPLLRWADVAGNPALNIPVALLIYALSVLLVLVMQRLPVLRRMAV